MSKKKKSDTRLELIGGVYIVEAFADGTERREEIDGTCILELVQYIMEKVVRERSAK